MAAQDLDQALALGWVDQSEPFLGGRLPGLRARNRDSRPQPEPFFPLATGNILK